MGTPVELYVYDLSCGLSKILSQSFLGTSLEGIWHTSIVVFEKEYYFGADGIKSCSVGGTILREPHEIVPLGETFVPFALFNDYLLGLRESTFTGASYDLFQHNCNHFTDEVAQFLCGVGIPKHILNLPDIIRETPVCATLLQLIKGLGGGPNVSERRNAREDSPEFLQLNSAIEEIRTLPTDNSYDMADSDGGGQNSESAPEEFAVSEATQKARDVVAEIEAEERKELEESKSRKRDPPVTFKDSVDVKEQFNALVNSVEGKLNAEEKQSLEELKQYMLLDEGSWALGDGFLNFVGKLLHDKSFSPDVRVSLLNVMSSAALKDDVILLLHQDRRDHFLMNYAGDVERLTLGEQQALALFLANLFENLSSSEWLLYISEWEHNNSNLSNIRVTTKVGINALLSENSLLQDRGSAIVYNMACKEVFDDVAIELTMALLQFLNGEPSEELLFRSLKSLARFCQISGQEVTQLIQMIGPDPSKFKGKSSRVDEQIELISAKLH